MYAFPRNVGILLIAVAATNVFNGTLKVALPNVAAADIDDPCSGTGFDKCFEELLHFITTEEVPQTIETDINIVVGLTRVGKSIITQIVANESNQLPVVCTSPSRCTIIDDSGTAGNSVISQTFLPNLVLHKSTTDEGGKITAFYDMPGFDDNRNVTIDIANAYFVRSILQNASRLRVVVVGLYSYFHQTSAKGMPDLIESLCQLFKHGDQLSESIAFVSNLWDGGREDVMYDRHIVYATELFDSRVITVGCRPFADQFMAILGKHTMNESLGYQISTHIRPFSTINIDHRGTNIRTNPVLQKVVTEMKEIVFHKAKYVPVTPSDFGYSLSLEARVFLERAAIHFNRDVVQVLDRVEGNAIAYLKSLYAGFLVSTTDKDQLTTFIENLETASFDFSNNENILPESCIDQTISQIETFAPGSFRDEYTTKLRSTLKFMNFIQDAMQSQSFSCADWVGPFLNFMEKLQAAVKYDRIDSKLMTRAKITLTESGEQLATLIEEDVGSAQDPAETCRHHLEDIVNSIQNSKNSHVDYAKYSDVLINLSEAYQALSANRIADPVDFVAAQLVETLGIQFEWKTEDWTESLQEAHESVEIRVHRPIKFESFLKTLFGELMVELVQSRDEENLNLMGWWRGQSGNTTLVWQKFSTESFEAAKIINSAEYDALTQTTANAARLRTLMNTALWPAPCPPAADEMIFVDNSISVRRVLSCIQSYNRKPTSVVLLARHSVYLDTDINGDAINFAQAPLVAILAPHWVASHARYVSLRGPKGALGPRPGGVGGVGKNAGHFFGVYLRDMHTGGKLRFDLTGGEGGDGAPGFDSQTRGQNAKYIEFDETKGDDCAAWKWEANIRVYPNTCSPPGCGTKCRCRIPNHTTIFGQNGTMGGGGGRGGNAGSGGLGGYAFVINLQSPSPTHVTFPGGALGLGGPGGLGAEGGVNAPNLRMGLTSKLSGVSYYCKVEWKKLDDPNPRFAPKGQTGATGIGRTSTGSRLLTNNSSMQLQTMEMSTIVENPLTAKSQVVGTVPYARYSRMFEAELNRTTYEFLKPLAEETLQNLMTHPRRPTQ